MLHRMYTDSPLLQEVKEQQYGMMDCNYSKVDIDVMVADLESNDSNNNKLTETQRKFEKGLFGGDLNNLKNCKPAHIKLKPGVRPYKGMFYNLPHTYEYTYK